MNIRTTITLLVATALVAGGYLLWHARRGGAGPANGQESTKDGRGSGALLCQPPLADSDDITRVEYQLGSAGLIFERAEANAEGTSEPAWEIAEAQPGPASGWMVNELVIAVKGLRAASQDSLAADAEAELTAAGIRPQPRACIALTRRDGLRFEVQLGRPIMPGPHTYIYLPSRPAELFLSADSLPELLARPLAAYRDRRLAPFDPQDAASLEITERIPSPSRSCRLSKKEGIWRFETPLVAAADSPRIDEVIHAAARLWVREWLAEPPADLAAVGLDPARLKVVIETTGPAGGRHQVTLAFSDRHPLQAEDVVYARRIDDGLVGLVNASALQDFTPDMTSWRDLRLLDFDAAQVSALTITRPDGAVQLFRDDSGWTIGSDRERADHSIVTDLLKSLATLRAVSYVDDPESTDAGLAPPAATVSLTLADGTHCEVQVGAPTDPTAGRLRYAAGAGPAPGQAPWLAKIHSRDVTAALGDLSAFRDRAILSCHPGRIERLELDRRLPAAPRRQLLTFERDDKQIWQLTAPVHRRVELAQVNALVAALADLRGEPAVSAPGPDQNSPTQTNAANDLAASSNSGGPCAALDDPDVRLKVHLGAMSVAHSEELGQAAPLPPAAQAEVVELHAVRQGQRTYVRRAGATACCQVPDSVWDKLMTELLDGTWWSFDPHGVRAWSWTDPAGELAFRMQDGRWIYSAEPDLPLDAMKVRAHLEQVRAMKTSRWVSFEPGSDSELGLDGPAQVLRVELDGERAEELRISALGPPDSNRHVYATLAGSEMVFLLSKSAVERLGVQLANLEAQ